jgi:hypothetical protein
MGNQWFPEDNWDECRTTIKQNDFTYQKRCCKSKMTNNNLKLDLMGYDGILMHVM